MITISNKVEVEEYIKRSVNKSDIERQADKEKSGVKLEGVYATNPVDDKRKIPVFVADYVLMDYGTGSIMGVPGHDERDYSCQGSGEP